MQFHVATFCLCCCCWMHSMILLLNSLVWCDFSPAMPSVHLVGESGILCWTFSHSFGVVSRAHVQMLWLVCLLPCLLACPSLLPQEASFPQYNIHRLFCHFFFLFWGLTSNWRKTLLEYGVKSVGKRAVFETKTLSWMKSHLSISLVVPVMMSWVCFVLHTSSSVSAIYPIFQVSCGPWPKIFRSLCYSSCFYLIEYVSVVLRAKNNPNCSTFTTHVVFSLPQEASFLPMCKNHSVRLVFFFHMRSVPHGKCHSFGCSDFFLQLV